MIKRKKKDLVSVRLLDPSCKRRKYVVIKGENYEEVQNEAKRRGLI
ncbi:MAG: hypothetical protein M0R17_09455 [Candidatus Omnitrophica bacterium]|jgi:hypothetical protein|nr:hypothetical protein [Candidatus Omnitrophota bacterium]